MAACLNADVIFLGVRAGLCYFEVCPTEEGDEEEEGGESVILSISTDGITAGESQQSCRRGRRGLV